MRVVSFEEPVVAVGGPGGQSILFAPEKTQLPGAARSGQFVGRARKVYSIKFLRKFYAHDEF
jgi:hypothetical protein